MRRGPENERTPNPEVIDFEDLIGGKKLVCSKKRGKRERERERNPKKS